MGFFLLLLVWSAVFVVAELIRPKPSIENARPLGLGDFNFPTATEGRAVPLIWGTVRLKSPNVTWYGGLRNVAITEKIKTGMFSSEDVITGFEYYLGMQLSLCRGPVDSVIAITINDKHASSGRTGTGLLNISAENIFGGTKHGSGGVSGTGNFYSGSSTQVANVYLTAKTGSAIGYRGTCYYVFEGGYMGTAPSVPPWAFELVRIPDGLNLAVSDPGTENVNSGDCNLMNVVYEIMTDSDWGLSIPIAQIDIANFRSVGSVLAAEGNGFSMVLDNEREASDLLSEVMRQADGSLYFDRATGLWRVILARDDYSIPSLDLYDEDNIIELTDFSRTTWQETTNQVRVLYVDRGDGYKDTFALAQDMANTILQNGTVSVDVTYPGVKNATLANRIAWRELSTLTYPLAKINFTVNRKGFDLVPGSVFRFSWARLGIIELVFRLARIDYGNIDDGVITVYAVQDVFAAGDGVFDDPPTSGWTDPIEPAIATISGDSLVFEAPGQMVMADPDNPLLNPRVWAGSRDTGGGTTSFNLYSEFAINPAGLLGSYLFDSSINRFLKVGEVKTAFGAYGSSAVRPATDYLIEILPLSDDLSELNSDGNETTVSSLLHVVLIGEEFIGYELFKYTSSTVITLEKIYRGLFNSVPTAHAANEKVWFIGQTGGGLSANAIPNNYTGVQVQIRSVNRTGVSPTTPDIVLPALNYVYTEPLPPRDPLLNGSYAPASGSFDTDYSTETGITGNAHNARGMSAKVTPRSWRESNVIADHIFDETIIDDSTEFNFKVTLDPDGTPVDTATFTQSGFGDKIVYILRNALIEAMGFNAVIPTTGRLVVSAVHWPQGFSQQTATQDMEFDFTVSTSLQGNDDHVFGALLRNTDSSALTVGETATFTMDIFTALPSSGIVEININSGGWTTLIAAGTSSNTVALTSGDSIQLRFDQYPAYDQFFEITSTGVEKGYGVLLAL